MLQRAAPSLWIFLSTPSARRATRADLECFSHRQFLSTPSARRATSLDPLHMVLRLISIHALREEGDHITSTVKYTAAQISIHALREEGDIVPAVLAATGMQFLSTPSARRATKIYGYLKSNQEISIHALREEGDGHQAVNIMIAADFYPRPPRGGRPDGAGSIRTRQNFYPRPPRGGRPISRGSKRCGADFYPRPPRGGRQQKQRQNLYFLINYTTFCTNLEEP